MLDITRVVVFTGDSAFCNSEHSRIHTHYAWVDNMADNQFSITLL